MTKVRFKIERGSIMPGTDVAYVDEDEGESLADGVLQAVVGDLSTSIEVTISGVTMFLAAWQDPEHWESDWAEKLRVDSDEVSDKVAELLTAAVEE